MLKRRIKTRPAPPRPRRGEPGVLRMAAGAIAAGAFDGNTVRRAWLPGGDDLSVMEIAAQIGAVLEADDDGAALARKLARRFGWTPDPRLVEQLAAVPCYVDEALKAMVGQWVEAFHVEVPFPPSAPVEARLTPGGALSPGVVGGVRRETAEVSVVIRVDGEFTSRWLPVEQLEPRPVDAVPASDANIAPDEARGG